MSSRTEGNLILSSFGADLLDSMQPEIVTHSISDVLIDPDEVPEFVFFPHRGGVVSIVRATEDGTMVEAGVVGSEAVFNLHSILGDALPTGSSAIVQNEGTFTRVALSRIRPLFLNDPEVRDSVLAFASFFLEQLTQNLVCNRLHAIEQRLSKWLLAVRDRVGDDELHLTHEFLSHMLGIHRPGVSIAVAALEMDGLLLHGRNRIVIRDRPGMLKRSCECYEATREKQRLFESRLVR
jgi:CRP-like cAMP-binding protein